MAVGVSWKPTTARSRPGVSPIARAADMAPSAIESLTQTKAIGVSAFSVAEHLFGEPAAVLHRVRAALCEQVRW